MAHLARNVNIAMNGVFNTPFLQDFLRDTRLNVFNCFSWMSAMISSAYHGNAVSSSCDPYGSHGYPCRPHAPEYHGIVQRLWRSVARRMPGRVTSNPWQMRPLRESFDLSFLLPLPFRLLIHCPSVACKKRRGMGNNLLRLPLGLSSNAQTPRQLETGVQHSKRFGHVI